MTRLFYKCDKSRFVNLLLSFAAYFCVSLCSLSSAQVPDGRPRFPVIASHIVVAMEARQLPTQGAQIKIAAPITATIEDPKLEILSVALVSPREIRLRMSCQNRAQCLSFFVLASYPEGASAPILPAKPELPLKTSKFENSQPPPVAIEATTPEISSATPADSPTLRAGSSAMLQIDGDRIHIFIQVICLESGTTGDKVRVTTRDHKQSYVAQIVTQTLLKGSL